MSSQPGLRLIFDENLSPRVARALHELGFNAFHVHGDGQPRKGSTDLEVLKHARRTRQTIVTSNHDMITLCAEEGESVVWIDQRSRTIDLPRLARLCFDQIADWEGLLADTPGPVCVRAMRTKCEVLDLDRAAELAEKRMRRATVRSRARKPAEPKPLGGLLKDSRDPA